MPASALGVDAVDAIMRRVVPSSGLVHMTRLEVDTPRARIRRTPDGVELAGMHGLGASELRRRLDEAGLVVSGTSPDGSLVEFVELPPEVHPYYVATQAHPEFTSRPDRMHPMFGGLVAAAVDRQRSGRLVEVEPAPLP